MTMAHSLFIKVTSSLHLRTNHVLNHATRGLGFDGTRRELTNQGAATGGLAAVGTTGARIALPLTDDLSAVEWAVVGAAAPEDLTEADEMRACADVMELVLFAAAIGKVMFGGGPRGGGWGTKGLPSTWNRVSRVLRQRNRSSQNDAQWAKKRPRYK